MTMNFGKWALAAAAVVVLACASFGAAWWMASREVVSGLKTLNEAGERRALLVYHPGLSAFPKEVTASFADGLARAGWRVDVTTASAQAPGDLSGYEMVVLGTPVYVETAARPLSAYIARVRDFHGKPVVLVFTAAGDAAPAMDKTAGQLAALNARVTGRYGYTSNRPNESSTAYPGNNQQRAAAMARDAALSLAKAPG